MVTAPAPATLRCHHCSHAIGASAVPMQFVGVFHPRRLATVLPKAHAGERRHRCTSCHWVNVFHPLPEGRPAIVLK